MKSLCVCIAMPKDYMHYRYYLFIGFLYPQYQGSVAAPQSAINLKSSRCFEMLLKGGLSYYTYLGLYFQMKIVKKNISEAVDARL